MDGWIDGHVHENMYTHTPMPDPHGTRPGGSVRYRKWSIASYTLQLPNFRRFRSDPRDDYWRKGCHPPLVGISLMEYIHTQWQLSRVLGWHTSRCVIISYLSGHLSWLPVVRFFFSFLTFNTVRKEFLLKKIRISENFVI